MKHAKKWMAGWMAVLLTLGIVAGCSSTPAYEAGTRTEKEFASEWIGTKFTVPEGMYMVSDEQLNQLMQISAEVLYEDSETGQKAIDYTKLTTVYEMMAQATDNSNVIVIVEKVPENMQEDKYVEALLSQVEKQFSVEWIDKGTPYTLAGKQYTKVVYDAEMNLGGTVIALQQTALVRKQGDRVISITFSYSDQAQYQKMVDGFSAL